MTGAPAEYYSGGNYAHYLDRAPRYARLARDIDQFLDTICLRDPVSPVLDLGCGPGLLVRELSLRGWGCVHGYDSSEWAVTYARRTLGLECVSHDREATFARAYHLTIALDVLEHVADPLETLLALRTRYLLVRVPVATADGGPFVLRCSEDDPTHVQRLTATGWTELLARGGFRRLVKLNTATLYDTEGVHVALYARA